MSDNPIFQLFSDPDFQVDRSSSLYDQVKMIWNNGTEYSKRTYNINSSPLTLFSQFSEVTRESGINYLGVGRNSINGSLKSSAIEDEVPVEQNFITTNANIFSITSYEDFLNHMNISISSKFPSWAGGASAKVDFVRTIQYNSTNIYMLVKITQTLKKIRLKKPTLTIDAKSILKNKGEKEFLNQFGDQFLTEVKVGGEMFAVVEFYSQTLSDKTYIKGEVDLLVGGFSLNGELQQQINKTIGLEVLKVNMYRTGTSSTLPNQSSLIGYVNKFPEEIAETGGTTIGEVYTDYTGAINDSQAIVPDLSKQYLFMRDLVNIYDNINMIKNSYEYANRNTWQFWRFDWSKLPPMPKFKKGGLGITLPNSAAWVEWFQKVEEEKIGQRRAFVNKNDIKREISINFLHICNDIAAKMQKSPLDEPGNLPEFDFDKILPEPQILEGLYYPLDIVTDLPQYISPATGIGAFSINFRYAIRGLVIKFRARHDAYHGGFLFKPVTSPPLDASAMNSFVYGINGIEFWLEGPRANTHTISYGTKHLNGKSFTGKDRETIGFWEDSSGLTDPDKRVEEILVTVRSII